MARIVVSGTMVRYPMAGMVQWFLGWVGGFHQLGHDVVFVEKATWPDSCFDPTTGTTGSDCSYGLRTVASVLGRHGLDGRWCYVDESGRYHGMSRSEVADAFASADVFLDLEWGDWREESATSGLRVFIDGEPGWFQIKLELQSDPDPPTYDVYYTVGLNIGTDRSPAPTAGIEWRHTHSPVLISDYPDHPASPDGAYVTIMNWRSHNELEYLGTTYGQKDVEFARFMTLPRLVEAPFTLAVAGAPPRDELRAHGWSLTDPHRVTSSIASFKRFLRGSRGYFSVAKNVRVETNAGWFSDTAGYSLATGRPVILQENGFSDHLPTGLGLFAVMDAEGAAAAVRSIEGDYPAHAVAARRIAEEHLDSRVVLGRLLDDLGIV